MGTWHDSCIIYRCTVFAAALFCRGAAFDIHSGTHSMANFRKRGEKLERKSAAIWTELELDRERESGRCDRDTRGRREGRHWPHGAPSLDVSKCYRCRAARHLLLFYRGERGYCLSQELHRKRCMNNMNAVRRVQSLSSRPIMCAHSILCIRRIKRRIGSRGATD